jgi:hypothetical protein
MNRSQIAAFFQCSRDDIRKWREHLGLPIAKVEEDGRTLIRYPLKEAIAWSKETRRMISPKRVKPKDSREARLASNNVGRVQVAVGWDSVRELEAARASNVEAAIASMLKGGRLFEVPSGTKVRTHTIVVPGIEPHVCVLGGPFEGLKGYVRPEDLASSVRRGAGHTD